MRSYTPLALLVVCGLGGCEEERPCPLIPGSTQQATLLSQMGLFQAPLRDLVPEGDAFSYDINVPLFSDVTQKSRLVFLPEGAKLGYRETGLWSLPLGGIVTKTFSLPTATGERLIETRLLVSEESGIKPYVFQWNEDQEDATCIAQGAVVQREPIEGRAGTVTTYEIPERGFCAACHQNEGKIGVIGLTTKQWDHDFTIGAHPFNTLQRAISAGLFDEPPSPGTEHQRLSTLGSSDPIEQKARSYLDANCAHCHSVGGVAERKELRLHLEDTGSEAPRKNLGICEKVDDRIEGARFVIAPGQPDQSAMILRMESSIQGFQMPLGPYQLHDEEGISLLRTWIESLNNITCED